jgi:hypothetical protein
LSETQRPRPAGLTQHILPIAGTMLGICTTLIGLVKLLETQSVATLVDEFAGLVGACFLFSAILSYSSIRTEPRPALSSRLERGADAMFLVGLTSLSVLSLVFAFELI